MNTNLVELREWFDENLAPQLWDFRSYYDDSIWDQSVHETVVIMKGLSPITRSSTHAPIMGIHKLEVNMIEHGKRVEFSYDLGGQLSDTNLALSMYVYPVQVTLEPKISGIEGAWALVKGIVEIWDLLMPIGMEIEKMFPTDRVEEESELDEGTA
jgi:hypothetical protein